ncbi:hypothetical protein TRFO_08449 [Tritrichomonas foetus]|uniref:Initiator binding domain-containing protein n=1 Tax=Tritrichomonas foetus TaxID=1144522 RepID=A0A1J4JK00_9EUKA|nr:hypothetical protein TRFO_08449 [Tritrichomonas foetus]|eukprot:OHS99486.1 hypothetical protein TRFO_08449 [Tritrichomonas foetus]
MITKCMAPYVFQNKPPLPFNNHNHPLCNMVPASNNLGNANNGGIVDTVKLLPIEERAQYKMLIDSISNDVQRARRHSGLSEFVKHITLVHRFVSQGNSNDSLRGIVCGVEFGRGFILVNTDRLKKVLYRSKSCMNGCFQRLGYDVMRPSHDLVCLFTRLLPNVNPEFFAIRQWCVRLVTDQCTLCFLSNMPESIASNFEVHRIPTQRAGAANAVNTANQGYSSITNDENSLNTTTAINDNINGNNSSNTTSMANSPASPPSNSAQSSQNQSQIQSPTSPLSRQNRSQTSSQTCTEINSPINAAVGTAVNTPQCYEEAATFGAINGTTSFASTSLYGVNLANLPSMRNLGFIPTSTSNTNSPNTSLNTNSIGSTCGSIAGDAAAGVSGDVAAGVGVLNVNLTTTNMNGFNSIGGSLLMAAAPQKSAQDPQTTTIVNGQAQASIESPPSLTVYNKSDPPPYSFMFDVRSLLNH